MEKKNVVERPSRYEQAKGRISKFEHGSDEIIVALP